MEAREQDVGLMQTIYGSLEKKIDLLDKSMARYLLRSIYAGIFLALPTVVGIIAWDTVGGGAPHIGKLVYSLIFPLGLMTIIFLNGELATSNMMFTFVGSSRGWLSWAKTFSLIIICTLMNLVGSVIVALLVSQSSTSAFFGPDSALMAVVNSKLDKGVWATLFDGILANIFVNIAIMGQLRIKEDVAKMVFITGVIFLFVYAGFEHVIANFGMMFIAFFCGNQLNIGSVLMNWIVSFIGNLIGGGVVMGLGYSWLNKKGLVYRD